MTRCEAALQAGFTRFRPVLMTALAMIIGMMPMALGLGDGGEQNAPLGRAVIGGLVFATVATLFFVPTVFSIIHGRAAATDVRRFLACLSRPRALHCVSTTYGSCSRSRCCSRSGASSAA